MADLEGAPVAPTADSPQPQFHAGEKVLVPHTDKYYEAKVQKVQFRADGQWHYLLHYSGWNKKWDEWVEEGGLQKAPSAPTPTAKKAAGKEKAPRAKKAEDAPDVPGPAPVQFHVDIPAALKLRMLDDYDAVKKEGRLVPLPRRPNIHEILSLYVRDAFERNANAEVEDDLAVGLKLYFDKALLFTLLYPQEREQAERLLASGKMPSAIFGAEHLMRLFWRLPELLPTVGMTSEQVGTLQARLGDVLRFVMANDKRFFCSKGGPLRRWHSSMALLAPARRPRIAALPRGPATASPVRLV
jgi:mortality factor 4-like protein 1